MSKFLLTEHEQNKVCHSVAGIEESGGNSSALSSALRLLKPNATVTQLLPPLWYRALGNDGDMTWRNLGSWLAVRRRSALLNWITSLKETWMSIVDLEQYGDLERWPPRSQESAYNFWLPLNLTTNSLLLIREALPITQLINTYFVCYTYYIYCILTIK